MPRKVFVSGCFDLLHSGHVAFLQEAATYGDLYVALGSDATVYGLKGRLPINNQDERLYMVQAVSGVKVAFVSSGSGMLDFAAELRQIKPDVFIVNADGNIPQKEALCRGEGIEYHVLQRQWGTALLCPATILALVLQLPPIIRGVGRLP
ncbi:MAG: adenylyltransferase/cytidyltransferase family protein [Anaerolineae bacterium]|nr:adenylyltransferase/cytidyltransferase family protein [Anaerolineae bacterium]